MVHQPDVPEVELRAIAKRYAGHCVLDGLDLVVDRGDYFAIIGPSGSGKTTVVRIIAGLEEATSGQVLLRGQDVSSTPPEHRNTPLVFQNFALFPHKNVVDNVTYGLVRRGYPAVERDRRVTRVLDLVGLSAFAGRDIASLSGGQRQRVALARALVLEAPLLLLDEPLAALDANLRVSMQTELRAIQRHLGITFVHVTGDQGEALALADRIAVMNQGRVEQVGTPEEIFSRPATRFVAAFVGKNSVLDGQVIAVDEGIVTLRTQAAVLRGGTSSGSVHRGASVTLVVRADRISLKEEGGGNAAENSVIGVVRQREYGGSLVTYTLDIGSDVAFRVEAEVDRLGHVDPRRGERVQAIWNIEDSHVIGLDTDRFNQASPLGGSDRHEGGYDGPEARSA